MYGTLHTLCRGNADYNKSVSTMRSWRLYVLTALFELLEKLKDKQADYRSPKAVRELAVYPDAVALRRICTVRGRTAAVILISLVRGENSEDIVDLLARELSESDRAQVRNIFSDMPSKKFFLALKVIFREFRIASIVSRSPCHRLRSFQIPQIYAWLEVSSKDSMQIEQGLLALYISNTILFIFEANISIIQSNTIFSYFCVSI